jgi:hypothetical protein
MSTSQVSSGPPASSSVAPPRVATLIPERYLDIPSQRLYALSFALLIQVRMLCYLTLALTLLLTTLQTCRP